MEELVAESCSAIWVIVIQVKELLTFYSLISLLLICRTMAEILLPVIFMAFLIAIKKVNVEACSVYDVAFFCES